MKLNALGSQVWYFAFALLGVALLAGCLVGMVVGKKYGVDTSIVLAVVGQASTLIGIAGGGMQADAKRSTGQEQEAPKQLEAPKQS